jgi:Fic family protein
MMVSLYRGADAPLDHGTLAEWHRQVMGGRDDLTKIGGYRTGSEPMQIVSGRIDAPRVHFEAPPADQVPEEMARFLDWFERTSPGGPEPLPAVTRSAVAHLYFESIHPFEDGNGRIGRAISEKALAQSLGRPTLTALAAAILARRPEYYAALAAANRDLNIDEWVAWFAGIVLWAQERTRAQVDFVIHKSKLLNRVRGRLNARQEKVVLRLLAAGPAGFEGGLSAGNYRSIAKTSPATSTRDLAGLVELGVLVRTGERRHARYHLPFPVNQPSPVSIDASGIIRGTPS